MCGFVGFTGLREQREAILHRMADRIIHRGPDMEGYHISGDDPRTAIALGFRRLSIIDLAAGKQPMYNEDGTVVVANCQTAGRGRMNRVFQSPRDQGIYLTTLLRPQLPPDRLMMVTAMAGVAVCEAVEQVCGVRPGLKWPNDPVLNGKKLCGILTELSLEGESGRLQYLAVGIGVNVGQRAEDFTPEVRPVATSLLQELGHPVSRPALAAAEIEALDRLYAALEEIDKKEAAARRTITPQFLTEAYAKRTVRISIAEALDAKTVEMGLKESVGKTAGAFVYLYPPGIPMLVPGEGISKEVVAVIKSCRENAFRIHGVTEDGKIKVVIS